MLAKYWCWEVWHEFQMKQGLWIKQVSSRNLFTIASVIFRLPVTRWKQQQQQKRYSIVFPGLMMDVICQLIFLRFFILSAPSRLPLNSKGPHILCYKVLRISAVSFNVFINNYKILKFKPISCIKQHIGSGI